MTRLAHRHRHRLAALALVAIALYLGKRAYGDASADDLAWILAPTAAAVSALSGGRFVYEAGAGWVDRDLMFTIAPSCAGVNFALAALLALVLGGLERMASARAVAVRLALAAAAAYAATLIVNTARIALALELHRGALPVDALGLGGLDPAELHRLEGIVVYVGGLLALHATARAIEGRLAPAADRPRPAWAWATAPIAAYLAVALGLPLLNGAAARGDFAGHAAWVLAGVGGVVATVALGRAAAGAMAAAARRRNSRPAASVVTSGGGR